MMARVLDLILVTVAFAACYGLPPFLALSRLIPRAAPGERILLATASGLASQAFLALLWDHLIGTRISFEILAYMLFWAVSAAAAPLLARPAATALRQDASPRPPREGWILALIVLLGMSVRSLDGLRHAALGQSDAYSHLNFLRQILTHSHLLNIVYPPGYSWVLALPTVLFHLDPYMVARYAGPFFGGLLILAIASLGRHYSPGAARFGAFLTACFPGFYLLIKTGMGAFANQLGLVLLPVALHLYLRREGPEARSAPTALFILVALGLGASVPLLLLNLLLIIAAHRLTWPDPPARAPWWRRTAAPLALLLPALLLATFHFLRPGEVHTNATATMVTGVAAPASSATPATSALPPARLETSVLRTLLDRGNATPAGRLLIDFLSIKRHGLGGPLMGGLSLALALLFTAFLIHGFRQRSATLKLLGAWGVLTTIQTSTGLFDFSQYQRSGWSLLEAIAWAGGILAAIIYEQGGHRALFRHAVQLAMAGTVIAAFLAPPAHRLISSGAEDDLVASLRALSDTRSCRHAGAARLHFEHPLPHELLAVAAQHSTLSIMTRRYSLFQGDQGDLVGAVVDPAADVDQILVSTDISIPTPTGAVLCLIDAPLTLEDPGILGRISPSLTHSIAEFQPILYAPNLMILHYLGSLPREQWQVRHAAITPGLTAALAIPLHPVTLPGRRRFIRLH